MPVDVELKKYDGKELRFYVKDPDKHSIPNLIAKLALRKPGVIYAAYIIDHPLVSDPEVVILTDGSRDPLDVLREVLEEARVLAKRFLEMLDEEVRRYEAGKQSSGS